MSKHMTLKIGEFHQEGAGMHTTYGDLAEILRKIAIDLDLLDANEVVCIPKVGHTKTFEMQSPETMKVRWVIRRSAIKYTKMQKIKKIHANQARFEMKNLGMDEDNKDKPWEWGENNETI